MVESYKNNKSKLLASLTDKKEKLFAILKIGYLCLDNKGRISNDGVFAPCSLQKKFYEYFETTKYPDSCLDNKGRISNESNFAICGSSKKINDILQDINYNLKDPDFIDTTFKLKKMVEVPFTYCLDNKARISKHGSYEYCENNKAIFDNVENTIENLNNVIHILENSEVKEEL